MRTAAYLKAIERLENTGHDLSCTHTHTSTSPYVTCCGAVWSVVCGRLRPE